nr:reverse transcriptase domain-containing protein [Tanacetum cinerariifolium]
MISPAFIEANYEVFQSLLREQQKQIHNEDLCTEMDYFSEEYDEEKELEPRPARIRETTLVPRTRSSSARRERERDNNKGKRNKDKFSLYSRTNHGLLSNLSKNPREISVAEKVAKTFEQPPRMLENTQSHDMTKYCHFHEDHRHDTNNCRELRHQIEEVVKSVQLSQLVNGKKGQGEGFRYSTREDHTQKRKSAKESTKVLRGITFPPLSSANNSSDPVIIKAEISIRRVNQVYMDSESLCEVIYEHCFLELKPSIRSLRVDSKISLVGFSREHSWPIEEVPLEITIENRHHSLYDPWGYQIPHPIRIGTVFSTYEPDKVGEGPKRLKEASSKNVGATYQRLVDKVFNDQIGQNLEAYIDDEVIKRIFEEDMVKDYKRPLTGIRANRLKVKAVTDLEPPRTLKDIPSLNKMLAALSRFLSKGVEKSLPFSRHLKAAHTKRPYNGQ